MRLHSLTASPSDPLFDEPEPEAEAEAGPLGARPEDSSTMSQLNLCSSPALQTTAVASAVLLHGPPPAGQARRRQRQRRRRRRLHWRTSDLRESRPVHDSCTDLSRCCLGWACPALGHGAQCAMAAPSQGAGVEEEDEIEIAHAGLRLQRDKPRPRWPPRGRALCCCLAQRVLCTAAGAVGRSLPGDVLPCTPCIHRRRRLSWWAWTPILLGPKKDLDSVDGDLRL